MADTYGHAVHVDKTSELHIMYWVYRLVQFLAVMHVFI